MDNNSIHGASGAPEDCRQNKRECKEERQRTPDGFDLLHGRLLTPLASLIKILCVAWICASAQAATITNTFSFQWQPTPALMGGLSTNDYFTNVVFRLYGTTNVALPLANWPLQTTLPAQPFLTQGPPGTDWTYPFVRPSGTMFFVMTAYVAKGQPGGDESPFSNTDFQLERPSIGPRINSLR